ncbi:MAG: hypothetical protein ACFFBL_07645 [Promethearchaeota archaeon]
MLWIVLLFVFVVIPVVVLILIGGRKSQGPPKPAKRTMLYAPGSTDIAGEVYHSPRKDSTMPFPLGKKEEREKTETFRRHSED